MQLLAPETTSHPNLDLPDRRPAPTPPRVAGQVGSLADDRERLASVLLARGYCDAKTLERARQVAADSGQPLERVLIQLGLVGERGPQAKPDVLEEHRWDLRGEQLLSSFGAGS